MSISSDIFISRKEAGERVIDKLLYEQKQLVEKAVKGMEDWELTDHLHTDLYFYNIEDDDASDD